MADAKGASAFISDGAVGSPQTLSGVEIRRCLTPLLFNGTAKAFGTRSGRRPGAGAVVTISGTTVSLTAGSCVVDAGTGNLDPPFLVSWGASVPSFAGTPADSSQPRVDVVYVRVDEVLGSPTTQLITIGYQAGTPASSPAAPTTVGVDSLPIARVCVLAYINVPQSGGGAATVTPGRDLALSGSVIRCNGASDYPVAANCVEGTILWDYSGSKPDFVVLIGGAWVKRDTTANPLIIRGSSTIPTNASGNGTIAYSTGTSNFGSSTFPGTPTVVASAASNNAGFSDVIVGTVGTTQFTFTARDSNGTLMQNASAVVVSWIAIYT